MKKQGSAGPKPVESVKKADLTAWPTINSNSEFQFTAEVPKEKPEFQTMGDYMKWQNTLFNGLVKELALIEKETGSEVTMAAYELDDIDVNVQNSLCRNGTFTISVNLHDDDTWTAEKISALKNIVENMTRKTRFTFKDKAQKAEKTAAQTTPAKKAGGRALPPTPQRKTTSGKEPRKSEPKEASAGSNGTWVCPDIPNEYKDERVVLLVKYSSIQGSKEAKKHLPKTTYKSMTDTKLPNAMMKLCTSNGWGLKGEDRTIKSGDEANYMVWNQVVQNPIKLTYKSGDQRSKKKAECWMLLVPNKDYKEGWEKQYKKTLADMGLAIRHISGQVSERKKELEKDKS